MITLTKYNSVQFSEVSNKQLAGVTLVYRSVRKDGAVMETAMHMGGEEFVPANGTEREVFRVWKNAIKLHWDAKRTESSLKYDKDGGLRNGGIAIKLRAATPSVIVVRDVNGNTKFRWNSEDSVFARIGLMPTARDIADLVREYKKKMHKAAQASFEALKTRFEFDVVAEEPTQNADADKSQEKAA